MSSHIKKYHSGRTLEEYQLEFPDAFIIPPSYKYKISKNSGKHMKTKKYKMLFSEMYKGDKNPNHKTNTTKLQRQLASKYSKEYWKHNYPGMSDVDIIKNVSSFAKKSIKNRLTETQLDYWLAKGYSEEDAKIKLKNRQTTFSKDICIQKYGKEKGLEVFNERQKKWKAKVFNDNQWIGNGLSKISNDLFEIIKGNYKDNEILTGSTEKFIRRKNTKSVYKYDFTYLPTKKIIEFNGDYWHCNPSLYSADYYHKIKKMTASEIWKYDEEKIKLAKNHGYKILVIWEHDYVKNPKKNN